MWNDSERPKSGLAQDIDNFIRDEKSGSFESLLLRSFERQYTLNEAYRIYCDSLKSTPLNVVRWQDVPAMPAKAFKIASLSCCPIDQAIRVFYSSGTTVGEPSKHYLDETAIALYNTSLRYGFWRSIPKHLPIIALMPPADEAPHSSLSFMLNSLGAGRFFWGDILSLSEALNGIHQNAQPVCLFGTAFAFLELFDETDHCWQLPKGSFVVETGGFKGRTRQVGKDELYRMIEKRLGIAPPHAVAEYGMSEMASQFYGAPGAGLTGGHWVRARIVDPFTEEDSPEGLLRHYDLANWNSVAAIQTQDMAYRLPNGAFELMGRSPKAELRGCSLSVEERWKALR